MLCKPQLPSCSLGLIFNGASVYIKWVCFSPVNWSYINLTTRPAKEPRGEEGKKFSTPSKQRRNKITYEYDCGYLNQKAFN